MNLFSDIQSVRQMVKPKREHELRYELIKGYLVIQVMKQSTSQETDANEEKK